MDDLTNVTHLRVTNGTKAKIVSRYDGKDYVWKPGDVLNLPMEAAEHIFGFGQEDKSRAMNRLGWMPSSDQRDEAYERLALIGFEPVEQVFQLPTKKRGKGLGNVRSPVTVEGTEGGASSGASSADPEDIDEAI